MDEQNKIDSRTAVITLVAVTAVWIITLIAALLTQNDAGSIETATTNAEMIFSLVTVAGFASFPFTIMISIIAAWLLFFQKTYRLALRILLFPLLSLLLVILGSIGLQFV